MRVAFWSLFELERGTHAPINTLPVRIAGIMFAQGNRFLPGFRFGGLDVAAHIGEDIVVRHELEFFDVVEFKPPNDRTTLAVVIDARRPAKLYKYGKFKHLDRALRLGEFQISPASSCIKYTDDPARQDDELERVQTREPHELEIRVVESSTVQPGTELKTKPKIEFRRRVADYYLFSLASKYDKQLLTAFKDADCCLMVNEPEKFIDRMHAAFEAKMPGWIGADVPIKYGETHALGVPFYKDRRFGEQQEYRLAWMPPGGTSSDGLQPIIIELGSIDAIASIREEE